MRERPLLIAGPCVLEDDAGGAPASEVAEIIQAAVAGDGPDWVFKASFDKANRSSASAFRGPGLSRGLEILAGVRERFGVPVLTDVHEPAQAEPTAEVVDILQVPAFLCRQTDLIEAVAAAAARHGRAVNLKKGQFMAPGDMQHAVAKARGAGAEKIYVTERGSCFGYGDLVVDMRSLVRLRDTGASVIFDATHSVQRRQEGTAATGGEREMAPVLARAAMAVGVDAIFAEVHPRPEQAFSDAANALSPALLAQLVADMRGAAAPEPPRLPAAPAPPDVLERAARVQLVLLDVDGVLTDGRIYQGSEGEPMSAFSVQDGSGLWQIRRAGLRVGIISGRPSQGTLRRAEALQLEHAYVGIKRKLDVYQEILAKEGLTDAEVCFVGDDHLDLPALRQAGFAVSVPNGDHTAREAAHWVTSRPGGKGAVRELCELLLVARGLVPEEVNLRAI